MFTLWGKIKRIALISFLLLLSGCTHIPQVADRAPWYETEADLAVKAEMLEQSTLAMTDAAGIHCYRSYLPWQEALDANWLRSHDMADYPAWQGYLLAAFAFKQAVTGESQQQVISLLIDGIRYSWRVTGIEGLLCRSLTPGYTGPRLEFMDTPKENPTKYWVQGPTGEWFKCGVAGGHYSGVVFGLSILLYLDRRGDIDLTETLESKAIDTLVTTVRYVVDNGYRIVDFNGNKTEYGNQDPQFFNSYLAVALCNYLKSAGYYDEKCAREYEKQVDSWTRTAQTYNEALGEVMKMIGRWRLEKISTSDCLHYAGQNYCLMLMEDRETYVERLKHAATGIWDFFQYERHPIYTFMYLDRVRPQYADNFMPAIIEDLRDFPDDKRSGKAIKTPTPGVVQPIANRCLSSYYWKSSCFIKFDGWEEEPDDDSVIYSGGDFLLAYWMGRYVGFVPEH
jgi:hypothetical protein